MRLETGLLTRDASMGTEAPATVVIPVPCAPKTAPCPTCGQPGHRKRALTRAGASEAVAVLEITYGEDAARCDRRTTVRNTPEGAPPKAHDYNKVRDLVIDRLPKDGGRHL